MDRPNWSRNVLMQNALEHNPWDYQEFMDSSPEGSVDAPGGVLPNPNSGPTGKDPVENALALGSFLPGLGGDVLGPLTDLRAMQQDPSKRTLANLALFGVGALPAVPSLMWMMNRASDSPIRRGLFSNQSGALGYHGTSTTTFDNNEFHSLSHFGSRPDAANDRLGIVPNSIQSFMSGKTPWLINSHIRKVDLDIKNPLRIRDFGGSHQPLHFAKAAYDEGVLTDAEYQALRTISFHDDSLENKLVAKALIKNLQSKGYDGFVYENIGEDIGQDSYVIFDKSQVHPGIGRRESAFGDIPKYKSKTEKWEVFDAKTGKVLHTFGSEAQAEGFVEANKEKFMKNQYIIDYGKIGE